MHDAQHKSATLKKLSQLKDKNRKANSAVLKLSYAAFQ